MIILFPLVSYLYIRSGFIYRKGVLDELKNKTELNEFQSSFITTFDSTFIPNVFNHGVTLFQKNNNEKDNKDLLFFAETLGKRSDFKLVSLIEKDNKYALDTFFHSTVSRILVTKEQQDLFFGDSQFLLARDSFLRNSYDGSEEGTKLAYEHTVVLLPMKKEDEVELRRTNH